MRKGETECIHFERCMKKMEFRKKKNDAENKKRTSQENAMLKQIHK